MPVRLRHIAAVPIERVNSAHPEQRRDVLQVSGHALPFLLADVRAAPSAASAVALVELLLISWLPSATSRCCCSGRRSR
jgi:hypothetical protein